MLGEDRLRLLTTHCWLFLTVTRSRAGEVHSDSAFTQVRHCANYVLPSDCCIVDLEDYIFLVGESTIDLYFSLCVANFCYKGNFMKIQLIAVLLCVYYMKPERMWCVCVCVCGLQRQQ